MHSCVIYRAKSNGLAVRDVQSMINSLRQYLEQTSLKKGWSSALPYALSGLNDLPEKMSEYSPRQLVFGRLLVSLGKCPPYHDGAEDAGQFFTRLVHDGNKVQMELTRIHDAEFCEFKAAHTPLSSTPGDRVGVHNFPGAPKLDHILQGPFEVVNCVSESRYKVNVSWTPQIFPVDGRKPYISQRDGTNAPIYYYSEREGLIETDSYIVARFVSHKMRGRGRNRKSW